MKVVNTFKYGWHVAEVINYAGFYKLKLDNVILSDLFTTRKDAEKMAAKMAAEWLGI